MTKRRIIKWLIGIVGLVVLLAIAVALRLPHIIDSEAVKERTRAFVSQRLGGAVTIEKIDLSWFPWPTVAIRDAAVVFSDNIRASVQAIKVHPSILSFFKGRFVVSRLVLERPVVEARLEERPQESLNIKELEEKIRAALGTLVSDFPFMGARIADGSLAIGLGSKPPIILREFDGWIGESSSKLEIKIAARSNIGDKIRLAGKIAADTLAAEARATIAPLHVGKALASLAPHPLDYLVEGDVKLDLNLRAVGLGNFSVDIRGSMTSLSLVHGNDKTVLQGKDFKVIVGGDERMLRAAIERLGFVQPRLDLSGEIMLDRTPSTTRVKIVAQNLDAKEIRAAAQAVAGNEPAVQRLFNYLRGGQLTELRFESKGQSLEELATLRNLTVSSQIRDGIIFVPGLELTLEKVAGSMSVSNGILEGKDAVASFGKVSAREGTLRVGLEGERAPVHIDVIVEGDAGELHGLLLRQLKDRAYLAEVSKIRNLSGHIAGRLFLDGPVDALLPRISVSKALLTASYDPIPFPIAVSDGRLDYDGRIIRVTSLKATVGRSSCSELTGSLTLDAGRRLEIDSASLSLDVEQIYHWLRQVSNLRAPLDQVKAARGKLDLASLSLSGPLNNPDKWAFRASGSTKALVVSHVNLPGPITLSQGKFIATAARFTFSEVRAELLDALFAVSGFLDNPIDGRLSGEGTGSGILGREMAQWLYEKGEFSRSFMLRSPVKFNGGRLRWSDDGDINMQGSIVVADGPRVSLDMLRTPHTVAARDLTVEDGAQRAQMTFQLDSDKIDLSFRGLLTQKTLDRIFIASPARVELLQGDIKANYFLNPPFHFSALGKLVGKNLVLPLDKKTMSIDRFFMDGGEGKVNIRSADLQWLDSRFSLSGTAEAAKDALAFEMDVAVDRVAWEDISEIMSRARNARGESDGSGTPPIRGTIRLKAERFSIDRFIWNPLHLTATILPGGINGRVEHGVVCGIQTVGRVEAHNETIKLDLRLSATDGQLEPASRCLTKQQIQGTYSLKADLSGAGDPKRLRQSLKGNFEFVARDGNFIRATGMDATFDYLNRTGDFNVAFPDLDKEAFPYRLINVKGSLDGSTIIGNEIIVRGASLTITGQAKVELERNQIDAKGLVSVAAPGSQVVKKLPLIGPILGGSLVGIPVRIQGPLDRPNVTYLSPKDLGTELLNMPLRILGLPLDAMRIFSPRPQEPAGK